MWKFWRDSWNCYCSKAAELPAQDSSRKRLYLRDCFFLKDGQRWASIISCRKAGYFLGGRWMVLNWGCGPLRLRMAMTVTIFPKIQVPFFPVNMVQWNIGVSPNSSYPSNILPFATEPWFGRKTVNCQSSWWFLITHSSQNSLVHWGRLFQTGVKVQKFIENKTRRVVLSLGATISHAVKMTKPRYWTKTTPWDSIT